MTDRSAQPALHSELLHACARITPLLERYQLPASALTQALQRAENFRLHVPIVGAFSSGKTSLLNALLGQKYFAVEINPETSLPVELRYGEQTAFTGHRDEQQPIALLPEQVLEQQYEAILPTGWVEATINAPLLARFPLLTLVDMPGWDSGIAQHAQAIDHYLERSLAYVIVVSAEEGNLRNSLRLFLTEMALRKMPAVLVIGKSDKKQADDLTAVVNKIHSEISELLGQPPLATAVVSVRKKKTDEFVSALGSLAAQVDECFYQVSVLPVLQLLTQLAERIVHLSQHENLAGDELQREKEKLQQDTLHFQKRMEKQNLKLDHDLQAAGQRIQQRVQARLNDNLPQFAHQLVAGSGLESSLQQTVRLTMAESIPAELVPVMKNYMHTVASDISQTIRINTTFSTAQGRAAQIPEESANGLITSLLTSLPMLLPQVGWPYKILTMISPLVIDWVKSLLSSKNRELEAAHQLENARGQLISQIYPSVMEQVTLQIHSLIQERAGAVKQQMAQEAQQYIARQQSLLDALQQQSQQDEAAFEHQHQQYRCDREEVEKLQALLIRPGSHV